MKHTMIRMPLLCLIMTVLLTACGSDNDDNHQNAGLQQLEQEDIVLPADGGSFTETLNLTGEEMSDLTIDNPAEDWLDVEIAPDKTSAAGRYLLTFHPRLTNDGEEARQAVVTLRTQGQTYSLRVVQRPQRQTSYSICQKDMPNTQSQFSETLDGKMRLLSDPVTSDNNPWVSVSIEPYSTTTSEVTVSLQPNKGLGRVALLRLGNAQGKVERIVIYQEPRELQAEETVNCKSGELQVLLGSDVDNLRRVRKLIIKGSLNNYDCYELRKFLISNSPLLVGEAEAHPISMDLSEADMTKAYTTDNPYKSLGYNLMPYDRNYGEGLPDRLFSLASNLTDVVLPRNLTVIGKNAFDHCTALRRIVIPASVREIQSSAFDNTKVGEIVFELPAHLERLGMHALCPDSLMKEVRLPATLHEMDGLLIHCERLYLPWTTPPDVRVYPNPKITRLFVPKGSKDAYQQAKCWKRFQIEEY